MAILVFKPRAAHHPSHSTAFGVHSALEVAMRRNEIGFAATARVPLDSRFLTHGPVPGLSLQAADAAL